VYGHIFFCLYPQPFDLPDLRVVFFIFPGLLELNTQADAWFKVCEDVQVILAASQGGQSVDEASLPRNPDQNFAAAMHAAEDKARAFIWLRSAAP
jgi:hypothetical protein